MSQSDFNIQINLPGTHRFLNVAGLGIDAVLARLDDPIVGVEDVSTKIQIATQEICANIVDHAYSDTQNGRLSIEIAVNPQDSKIDIYIRDSGKEFIESSVREPDLGQLQEGGFGLFFAKKVMDEVTYFRKQDENYWHLVKYFTKITAHPECEINKVRNQNTCINMQSKVNPEK